MVNQRLRINRHLKALVGERHPGTSPRALQKAAHYLSTQFAKLGCFTGDHLVSALGKTYRNVVAIREPDWQGQGKVLPPLLVGAHYDTVPRSPGADDNASGLVVILEVAFGLRAPSHVRPVWLVAFCLEEQDRLGSQAFASRLKTERHELTGAIILECVGFAKSEAGTQQVPPDVPIAVPTQGDFLAIVGNEASRFLVVQLEQEARQHDGEVTQAGRVGRRWRRVAHARALRQDSLRQRRQATESAALGRHRVRDNSRPGDDRLPDRSDDHPSADVLRDLLPGVDFIHSSGPGEAKRPVGFAHSKQRFSQVVVDSKAEFKPVRASDVVCDSPCFCEEFERSAVAGPETRQSCVHGGNDHEPFVAKCARQACATTAGGGPSLRSARARPTVGRCR